MCGAPTVLHRRLSHLVDGGLALAVAMVALTCLGLATGCGSGGDDTTVVPDDPDAGVAPPVDGGGPDAEPPFPFARCDEQRAPLPPLIEDRRVYAGDTLEVRQAHLTITDQTGWDAVNAGVPGAVVAAHFAEGDFGAGSTEPNATVKIRGGFSRLNAQKNYKVEIADGFGRWQGGKEINLNKHMTDLTRIRNKMAFDLFQTIPDLTSLRTQFVQLDVNGVDYGLYTWIEEADRRFLEHHGLDPMGSLYKAVGFHFQRISPAIAADPEQMKLVVEAKANPDDGKFLRMVDALNDRTRDIDEVIATYFNRDNLATWLAVNVLLGNIDNRTQNFYLYSPSSCDGWYLLPWDYDGAWGFYTQLGGRDIRERWEEGLSNYWPSNLFERFFSKPANVALVDAKIRELAQDRLTDAITAARIASYHDVVLPFIARDPDLHDLPGHFGNAPPSVGIELWEGELARITPTVSRFQAEYATALERPMPVFLATEPRPTGVEFRWDASFDLQHDPIAYDLQVATSPTFLQAELVFQALGVTDDELLVSGLPSGTYYWRVVIEDTAHADAWQLPYDPWKLVTIP